MLDVIGVADIEQLFDEIPAGLRSAALSGTPAGMNEMEVAALMRQRAGQDGRYVNFVGAGAYEHHIPAAVWELTTRGEFYSAYTPYQAEASQGTLQLLYEYQTMMASLTGLDVSNASLYDGASALAEGVLGAVRSHKKARRILLPQTVHPIYRRVVESIVSNQQIELVDVPFGPDGRMEAHHLSAAQRGEVAALVIPQPNFFGLLEDVDALVDAAHDLDALAIALVNPTALALLQPPGAWGREGADFAVGEGQPLGVPLSSGGPYFGFMCCKQKHVRQMPGRIVGRTVDLDHKPGFTLTLQAREQHIRRSKATSNICTNQGLMVTAATIYLALLGAEGLRAVAAACHANTRSLVQRLTAIEGVAAAFDGPYFHEAVLRLDRPVAEVLRGLEGEGIVGGFDLSGCYPDLGETLLVCATETRSEAEIARYANVLSGLMGPSAATSEAG